MTRDLTPGEHEEQTSANERDVEEVRARMLSAIDRANVEIGGGHEMPGLRDAIETWPDRRAASRLPAVAREFIERELGACDSDE